MMNDESKSRLMVETKLFLQYNFNLGEGMFQALEAEHYVLCGGAEH